MVRLGFFVFVVLIMMSISVVVSSAMVSVVAVMVVSMVRRGNGHLEVVPSEVCEHTVLDVTTQVSLLGERVSVLF